MLLFISFGEIFVALSNATLSFECFKLSKETLKPLHGRYKNLKGDLLLNPSLLHIF